MSYSFVIKSTDKISGTNNNGIYNINFRILPADVEFYEASFSFYTTAGFYRDVVDAGNAITNSNANGYITTNFINSRSMNSLGSPTNILGNIVRQVDPTGISAHPNMTYLYADCTTNTCPKIIAKPTLEQLSISVYNTFGNGLFVNTDHNGGTILTDMTSWIMTINLRPIKEQLPST